MHETTTVDPSQSSRLEHRSARTASGDELAIVGLLTFMLRHRVPIGTMLVLSLLVTELRLLSRPRSYTATASFMPQTRKLTSSLSALAAQFGLSPPVENGGQSPDFYLDLLKSREILGAVVDAHYQISSTTRTVDGTLTQIYGIRNEPERDARDVSIRRLRQAIAASIVPKTGVVRLSIRAGNPALAVQIAQQILAQLNTFNLDTRQSQAAAERRFVEKRLGEVEAELRDAEDRLQLFLQRNRDFRNSPQLSFQQDRLARDITMRQQLYSGLLQAFEQAKIEEVRDTPVLTVIERPEVPGQPDPRGLVRNGVLALFIGVVIGGLLGLADEAWRRTRTAQSPEFVELRALGARLLEDLRTSFRGRSRFTRR